MTVDPAAPSTDLARREPRITCLLADPVVGRATLAGRYLSGRGIAVIGTPSSAGELVTLAELHRPNVLVVDDELAPEQGHTLTRVLSSRAQRSAIIVATNGGDRDFLIQSLEAGARGILSRRAPLRDLVRAIEMVCDGRYSISVRMLGLLDDSSIPARMAQLDARERAVLRLVVNGLRVADLLTGLVARADRHQARAHPRAHEAAAAQDRGGASRGRAPRASAVAI